MLKAIRTIRTSQDDGFARRILSKHTFSDRFPGAGATLLLLQEPYQPPGEETGPRHTRALYTIQQISHYQTLVQIRLHLDFLCSHLPGLKQTATAAAGRLEHSLSPALSEGGPEGRKKLPANGRRFPPQAPAVQINSSHPESRANAGISSPQQKSLLFGSRTEHQPGTVRLSPPSAMDIAGRLGRRYPDTYQTARPGIPDGAPFLGSALRLSPLRPDRGVPGNTRSIALGMEPQYPDRPDGNIGAFEDIPQSAYREPARRQSGYEAGPYPAHTWESPKGRATAPGVRLSGEILFREQEPGSRWQYPGLAAHAFLWPVSVLESIQQAVKPSGGIGSGGAALQAWMSQEWPVFSPRRERETVGPFWASMALGYLPVRFGRPGSDEAGADSFSRVRMPGAERERALAFLPQASRYQGDTAAARGTHFVTSIREMEDGALKTALPGVFPSAGSGMLGGLAHSLAFLLSGGPRYEAGGGESLISVFAAAYRAGTQQGIPAPGKRISPAGEAFFAGPVPLSLVLPRYPAEGRTSALPFAIRQAAQQGFLSGPDRSWRHIFNVQVGNALSGRTEGFPLSAVPFDGQKLSWFSQNIREQNPGEAMAFQRSLFEGKQPSHRIKASQRPSDFIRAAGWEHAKGMYSLYPAPMGLGGSIGKSGTGGPLAPLPLHLLPLQNRVGPEGLGPAGTYLMAAGREKSQPLFRESAVPFSYPESQGIARLGEVFRLRSERGWWEQSPVSASAERFGERHLLNRAELGTVRTLPTRLGTLLPLRAAGLSGSLYPESQSIARPGEVSHPRPARGGEEQPLAPALAERFGERHPLHRAGLGTVRTLPIGSGALLPLRAAGLSGSLYPESQSIARLGEVPHPRLARGGEGLPLAPALAERFGERHPLNRAGLSTVWTLPTGLGTLLPLRAAELSGSLSPESQDIARPGEVSRPARGGREQSPAATILVREKREKGAKGPGIEAASQAVRIHSPSRGLFSGWKAGSTGQTEGRRMISSTVLPDAIMRRGSFWDSPAAGVGITFLPLSFRGSLPDSFARLSGNLWDFSARKESMAPSERGDKAASWRGMPSQSSAGLPMMRREDTGRASQPFQSRSVREQEMTPVSLRYGEWEPVPATASVPRSGGWQTRERSALSGPQPSGIAGIKGPQSAGILAGEPLVSRRLRQERAPLAHAALTASGRVFREDGGAVFRERQFSPRPGVLWPRTGVVEVPSPLRHPSIGGLPQGTVGNVRTQPTAMASTWEGQRSTAAVPSAGMYPPAASEMAALRTIKPGGENGHLSPLHLAVRPMPSGQSGKPSARPQYSQAGIAPVEMVQRATPVPVQQREEKREQPAQIERIRQTSRSTKKENTVLEQRVTVQAPDLSGLGTADVERLAERVYAQLERRIRSEQAKRGG